jgi:heterodisulfide reductase subunit C
MESLRQLAIAEKSKPPEKEVAVFNRIFLKMIKRYGRVYEAGLAAFYNLFSKHFFANLSLVPSMLFKRKLSILPVKVKGAKKIARIFDRVKEIENEKVSG